MDMPTSDATVIPAQLWRLWAKWPRTAGERRYHPVICHLIDVASVARLMWTRALTRRQRSLLASELGVSEDHARDWIAFWAGLHDIGKVSPAFQTQIKEQQGGAIVADWLRAAGLPTQAATWQPHGAISVLLLENLLSQAYSLNETLTARVAALVGAHHGLFFSMNQLSDLADPRWIGDQRWWVVQEQMAHLLAEAIELPQRTPSGQLSPSTGMMLAGFISVADWVGSNVDRFPLAGEIDTPQTVLVPRSLRAYANASLRNAARALEDIAWDDADLSGRPSTFETLFPGKPPRPVQCETVSLASRIDGPGLILLEVPMGEGKTEAAMYLADTWSARLGMRGAYFALPTQATSNQMFGRARAYLENRFRDDQVVNLHLAHGMAALSEQYESLRQRARLTNAMLYDEQRDSAQTSEASDAIADGERGAVIAASWFAAAKRTLLTSYGVGTIDQSLLAVLQVKHVFVRLFGLSGKTVILDEVHAYDVYMSTLMERLLQWLGALGSPVVLLSATLPAARRQALLAAYARGAGWPTQAIEQRDYPRITYLLGPHVAESIHVEADASARPESPLRLRRVTTTLPSRPNCAFALADALRTSLSGGGCVAIVCNTVGRAQNLFQALVEACALWPAEKRPDLALLHARFPFNERQEREKQALSDFSLTSDSKRNPRRPVRKILVATQVIEQSLDLDFDLMISDLAPIDLLLQRAGRLHRHRQNDPCRPVPLRQPELWISQADGEAFPGVDEGTPLDPSFDRADEFVYSPHILLRTWHALRHVSSIIIPGDIERLIAEVYDEDAPPPADSSERFAARWIATRERDQRAVNRSKSKAQAAVILPPTDDMLFYDSGRNLEEDAPDVHQSLQAQTRDGDPSLSVVLLDATTAAALRRSQPPNLEEARALLGRSLSLSHRGLVQALLADPTFAPPSGWLKTPWLRHHRLIALDANRQAHFNDGRRIYTLTLDTTLGVKIESRKLAGKE